MPKKHDQRTYRVYQHRNRDLVIFTWSYPNGPEQAASDLYHLWPETKIDPTNIHFDRRNLRWLQARGRQWQRITEDTI